MREVGRNKVGTDFLSFPLTSSRLYVGVQSICHPVLDSVQSSDSDMVYPWSIFSLFGFFCHRAYCRRSSNVLSIWSLWVIFLSTVFCVYEEGRKKIVYVGYLRDAHFCVQVRSERDFCVYVEGRKEGS